MPFIKKPSLTDLIEKPFKKASDSTLGLCGDKDKKILDYVAFSEITPQSCKNHLPLKSRPSSKVSLTSLIRARS